MRLTHMSVDMSQLLERRRVSPICMAPIAVIVLVCALKSLHFLVVTCEAGMKHGHNKLTANNISSHFSVKFTFSLIKPPLSDILVIGGFGVVFG